MTVSLLYSRNWHNIVNQLCFNKKNLTNLKIKRDTGAPYPSRSLSLSLRTSTHLSLSCPVQSAWNVFTVLMSHSPHPTPAPGQLAWFYHFL